MKASIWWWSGGDSEGGRWAEILSRGPSGGVTCALSRARRLDHVMLSPKSRVGFLSVQAAVWILFYSLSRSTPVTDTYQVPRSISSQRPSCTAGRGVNSSCIAHNDHMVLRDTVRPNSARISYRMSHSATRTAPMSLRLMLLLFSLPH